MPFENDPLQPPPDDKSGAQGGRLLGGDPKPPPALTPQQILEAEYEQDLTRREQIAAAQKKAAHNSSVKQLYAFIVMFSLCCTSCGLFSSLGYNDSFSGYSEEAMERRINRLYQTGYDPLMEPATRQEWIDKHGNPEKFEFGQHGFRESMATKVRVIVQRNGQMEVDTIYFTHDGLIQSFYPDDKTPHETYSFSDAAKEIDSSVYPKTVDDIPEDFYR